MESIAAKASEVMHYVLINSKSYWGTGVNAGFFLFALFLLIVNNKKNEKDKFLLIYIFIIAFLCFFPVTAGFIMSCIGTSVYWRMYWLIPLPIIVAYVIVTQLEKVRNKNIKIITAIISGLTLVIGGNFLYTKDVFDYDGNVYGVPETTIDVCNAIIKDARKQGISEYCIAASEEFSPWIRQYEPSIKMLYGRNGKNVKGKDSTNIYEIYSMLSIDNTLDWNKLLIDAENEEF